MQTDNGDEYMEGGRPRLALDKLAGFPTDELLLFLFVFYAFPFACSCYQLFVCILFINIVVLRTSSWLSEH